MTKNSTNQQTIKQKIQNTEVVLNQNNQDNQTQKLNYEEQEKQKKGPTQIEVFYSQTKYLATLLKFTKVDFEVLENDYRKMTILEGLLCSLIYWIIGGLLLFFNGTNLFFITGNLIGFLTFAINFLFIYVLPVGLILMWFLGKNYILGIPYIIAGFIGFGLLYFGFNYVINGYIGKNFEKKGIILFIPFSVLGEKD